MENYWNKLVKGCVLPKSRRYSQQAWEKLPREKLFWALFISGFQVRQRLKSVFLNWHVKPTLYDAFIHQPRRQNHRIFRILNDLESFLWHLLTDCPFLLPTHPGHRDKGCNLHTWHFSVIRAPVFLETPYPILHCSVIPHMLRKVASWIFVLPFETTQNEPILLLLLLLLESVALQYSISFSCTPKWISCTYTFLFFGFPFHLGHCRALSRVPCAVYSRFSLVIYFMCCVVLVTHSCPNLCDSMDY